MLVVTGWVFFHRLKPNFVFFFRLNRPESNDAKTSVNFYAIHKMSSFESND